MPEGLLFVDLTDMTRQIKVLREVDISEALIQLRSDGIIHVHYKKDTSVDIELQLKMRTIYWEIADHRKSKFIFSADSGFSVTKAARENSIQMEAQSPILCYAIIASNLAHKLIANFYLLINKPRAGYKLFSTTEDAAAWLHTLEK